MAALEENPLPGAGGDGKEQGEEEDWCKLGDDLRIEILGRLPEESLIAFKRVSKDWYFLISYACVLKLSPPSPSIPICGVLGPCFARDSTRNWDIFSPYIPARTSNNIVFSPHGEYFGPFLTRLDKKKPDPIVTFLMKSLPFTLTTKDLLDCCNGFLLISISDVEPTQYLVCNPATHQTITIPVNPKHHYDQNSILVDSSLLFDPSESLEYKIIRFVHSIGKASITFLDVFSSETSEWIEYKLPLEPKVTGIGWLKSSVYLDGVLYRISGDASLICIRIRSYPNLADLNAWDTIKFPDQQQSSSNNKYVGSIGASRGNLYYFNRNASHFLIYMLNGSTQWVLNHNISLYCLQNSMWGEHACKKLGDKVWSTIQPFALLPSSKDILLFETPWFVATYRFKDGLFALYVADSRGCETRRFGQSFPYSRSLVVLNSSIIKKPHGSYASFRMCSKS